MIFGTTDLGNDFTSLLYKTLPVHVKASIYHDTTLMACIRYLITGQREFFVILRRTEFYSKSNYFSELEYTFNNWVLSRGYVVNGGLIMRHMGP